MLTSRRQPYRPSGGFFIPSPHNCFTDRARPVFAENSSADFQTRREDFTNSHTRRGPNSQPNTKALKLKLESWQTESFGVTVNRRLKPDVKLLQSHRLGLGRLSLLFALFVFWNLNSVAVEVKPERWRWSNPLPHGNNVLDMFVTGDLAVQVGDAGTVYVQRDDERWTPAITGVTNYLRGTVLLGERFIVTGENGCILWSDDGKTFQPAQLSPATSDWFEGVAASGKRAVAVGDNGSIYTSTNGVDWTKTTSGTSEWLRGVAFGNSTFVAVGEYGTILHSSSATSWNRITSGTAHLNRVRYFTNASGGQFIAVGNGGVAFSSASGSSGWTSLNSGTTNNLFDVAANDTGILLVGDQELRFCAVGMTMWIDQITASTSNAPPAWVYLSASGVTNHFHVAGRTGLLIEGSLTNGTSEYVWQTISESSHAWLWDVTVQKGIYVAVGDLATILTSLDGILWAREVVPVPHTNTVLLGVGGTTNLLLAVGNAGNVLVSRAGLMNLTITNYVGTNIIVTNTVFDTFGTVWTNLPAFTTNTLQGVAANDNLFAVCGDFGGIFTSSDSSNWTAQVTPTTNFLSSVAAFPGGWVAVGNRGTLLRSEPNAGSWTSVNLGTTNWLYRVRWTGDQLIVVGQNGAIYTSEDGSNWADRASGTTRWLNDVTSADGTWFIVGNQGTLLSSTDLVNWTSLPVPTIKSLYTSAAVKGQLLIAGIEGIVLRNQVVPHPTPVNFLAYDWNAVTITNTESTNANPLTMAYELFLLAGEPDQFFEFQSATNLSTELWTTNATFELYDASGTLYLIRSRNITNAFPSEFYRTRLLP